VSAKDKGTGKEQKIRIEASSGLTDAEIQRMKQEAQANADTDKKAKETVEKINQADSLIFQTEKQLKEYGEKLSEGNKSAISNALERLKEAHKNKDLTGIDNALNTLNAAWQAAASEMYASTGATGAPGQDPSAGTGGNQNAGSSDGNNVSDVEYEEVNDSKK
jgi:molecular chaperone DnaK